MDDATQTKELQRELEELWAGDDDAITATSESIISITVTDSVTARQTEAVATTIAAALTVLAVFFWVTLARRRWRSSRWVPSCSCSSVCWAPWRCWVSPTR